MIALKIPDCIKIHEFEYQKIEDIPETVFENIRKNFQVINSGQPLVSINIIAWNEELNILRTLSSLSNLKSSYPLEFIFVDNNSTDKTAEIIRRCGLSPISELKQGYGFARQTALENSKGKYILTGDADTSYQPKWVDRMVEPIIENHYIGTYGTFSFIPEKAKSRLRFVYYELMRNIVHYLRSKKHPELVVYGMNFCFPREEALKIGFIRNNSRMEDGQMAMALLKLGKLKRVTKSDSIAWTGTRTVNQSGPFFQAISSRIFKEIKRFKVYFSQNT
jgi:glycosyltransferase involved in cell wall biosynthesis